MSEYDSMSRELEWDDEIEYVDNPFEVLPEGDYDFTVKKFERARHGGSEKIPPCSKAILTLAIFNREASGSVQTHLFLHSKFQWKLFQFFASIGKCEQGAVRVRMNWGAVPGATGYCHVGIREWTDNNGKKRESNEITEFYAPEKNPVQPQGGLSTAPGNYTPGQF